MPRCSTSPGINLNRVAVSAEVCGKASVVIHRSQGTKPQRHLGSCPQGTVSRQHTPHSPAHRRHRGQDAPQAAALEAPCLQLQTQTMHPAGQAGAGGECCAADVSRRREERSGCRAGWRGAGPLPWVGLFPPCPLLRAGPQQALVSVGNGPVCTISRSLLEHDLLPYPVLGCV